MRTARKYLLLITILIHIINISTAVNSTAPDVIIVIEDVRHISNETVIIGYNDTISNYTGSDLTKGQDVLVGGVPGTFHEPGLMNGTFSPDCASCHRPGGVAPKQIDVEAFRKSVHAKLNNRTEGDVAVDTINKACWSCHGNGSKPSGHPEEYRSPRSCASCHSFGSAYNAPLISGHTKAGRNLTIRTSCESCHGNAVVEKGVNKTRANVSHYGGKVIYNSTDCLSCHVDSVNSTLWGNAPRIYSHAKNGSCADCHASGAVRTLHDANLTVPAERTCSLCHTSADAVEKYGARDAIRTHYPGAIEGRANTTRVNSSYTCEKCHESANTVAIANANFSLHNKSLTKNILYQNLSQGNSSQTYCSECHSLEGVFPFKPVIQIPRIIHGNQTGHTAIGMKINCETCHDSAKISRFHKPSLAWERPVGRITDSSSARCTDCHNTHIKQTLQNITCTTCHSGYDASHYSSLIVENINKTLTCGVCHNEIRDQFHNLTERNKYFLKPEVKANDTRTLSCESCHNATGNERFHYSEFPTGAIQSPGWFNWTNGSRVNKCSDCHVRYGSQPPFNATNLTEPLHRAAQNCTLCHGGDTPIALHVLQRSNTAPYIKDIIMLPRKNYAGENISLSVLAVSGWEANITSVEYFIDMVEEGGKGRNLTMGKDLAGGQVREAYADIDTSDLKEGTHIVSVHAQDSKGRWGDVKPAPLVIYKNESKWFLFEHMELVFLIIGVLTLIYLFRKLK